MFTVKILENARTKYNKNICVLKPWFGKAYVQVNNLTQSGGIVEEIWNKTLRHIWKKDNSISSVLVLGLGGGTVARLIQKYWPNAEITGVEIDQIMVNLGKKYLELDDKKVKIVIGDALKYKPRKKFDLVIVDTYLGDKYVEVKNLSTRNASITIFNRLFYGAKKQEALKFGEKLKQLYKKVDYFYPQANIMFICYT